MQVQYRPEVVKILGSSQCALVMGCYAAEVALWHCLWSGSSMNKVVTEV